MFEIVKLIAIYPNYEGMLLKQYINPLSLILTCLIVGFKIYQ